MPVIRNSSEHIYLVATIDKKFNSRRSQAISKYISPRRSDFDESDLEANPEFRDQIEKIEKERSSEFKKLREDIVDDLMEPPKMIKSFRVRAF